MTGNPYVIVIELPKSDGFHTKGDRHLADTVQRRVQAFLDEPHGVGRCTTWIERRTATEE